MLDSRHVVCEVETERCEGVIPSGQVACSAVIDSRQSDGPCCFLPGDVARYSTDREGCP